MSDFFAYFLTYLPTPVRFCPTISFKFYYMVSDFGKSTYLPKNRTSFMDVPPREHIVAMPRKAQLGLSSPILEKVLKLEIPIRK